MMEGRVQVVWAQFVGLSIKGGTMGGLDRERAGAYIVDIINRNQSGQRLNITVRLPDFRKPFIQDLRLPTPPMVD